MSLTELLINTPKPWANLSVNSVTTASSTNGNYSSRTVPARLLLVAGSLNNVQKNCNVIITTIGSSTLAIIQRVNLTPAEMNASGRLTFEIDAELAAVDGILLAWDQGTSAATYVMLQIEMRSDPPAGGKTIFKSLRNDIARIAGTPKLLGSQSIYVR